MAIYAVYEGLDGFNRPVFKAAGNYYCLVAHLFSNLPTQTKIDAAVAREGGLHIKGNDPDGEPSHLVKDVIPLMVPINGKCTVNTQKTREIKEKVRLIHNIALSVGEAMRLSNDEDPVNYAYAQGMNDIATATDTWKGAPFESHPIIMSAKRTAANGFINLVRELHQLGMPERGFDEVEWDGGALISREALYDLLFAQYTQESYDNGCETLHECECECRLIAALLFRDVVQGKCCWTEDEIVKSIRYEGWAWRLYRVIMMLEWFSTRPTMFVDPEFAEGIDFNS